MAGRWWRDHSGCAGPAGPRPGLVLRCTRRLEVDRRLAADEDVWLAGRFAAELPSAGDTLAVSAWAGDLAVEPPPAVNVVTGARDRARALVSTAGTTDEVMARLVLAADAFVTTSRTSSPVTRSLARGHATP